MSLWTLEFAIFTEAHSEPYQTSMMNFFAERVTCWKPSTTFNKRSILDVWKVTNKRNHAQHFNLLFFKKKLHLRTSEQMSTYGKLNLLSIKSIYLVFLLEKGKEDSYRPKYTTSFLLCLKRTSQKPLKVTAAKQFFPSMYIINKTWLDLCFLFHIITERHYLLKKFNTTQRFGATAMLLRSLIKVFWNSSAFYVRYL